MSQRQTAAEIRAELQEARERIAKLGRERDEAFAILADLLDPDDCWYDHHGYCQAHGWMEIDPPCAMKRARELITEVAP